MPIGALLNNTLNYQEKNEVIKEYGLDDEEFKERMRDMCNLGEALELEARQEESKRKDISQQENLADKYPKKLGEMINRFEYLKSTTNKVTRY